MDELGIEQFHVCWGCSTALYGFIGAKFGSQGFVVGSQGAVNLSCWSS